MLKEKPIIQFCIAVTIALFPLAHLKFVFFGIPLYSVEAPILIALVAYLYGWKRRAFSFLVKINFRDPMIIGAALFFLGAVVSFIANPFSLTGLGMLKTWFVMPLLMVWLIFQAQPNEQEKNFFLNTWFATVLLVACGTLVSLFINTLTYDGRLAAWFASPNYLAIFIAPGILIAFHKLQEAFEEKKEIKGYIPSLLALLIFLPVLFLTHSYGVWLGVFGAVVLMTFLSAPALAKKHLWKVLGVVIVVVGIFFFFESSSSKWQSLASLQNRSSMASRMMIWQSAGKMIANSPVLGVGLGRFQEVYLEYQKYYPPYLEWAVPQPHNIILAVWLQTGLIGLIGFILLVIRSIYILMQNKNREAILLLGILVLYLLYGIFDTPYFKTDLAFAFWLVIALIFTLSQPSELPNHKSIR